jgi:beta-phosphoglucomutase-like phosphatase (HAD superfamily)
MIKIPSIGVFEEDCGLIKIEQSSDKRFKTGLNCVESIVATGDRKVEFICFETHSLAYVGSQMGYPAYYPVHPVKFEKSVKAVLMDLDGTSVRSEEFWIWIIELTIKSLMNKTKFEFEACDLPFVSGHSVSEHLQYCIRKYCPDKSLDEARNFYFEHTHREMKEILEGRGKANAFTPVDGLKDFLMELKSKNIKIGLVTSGLYEKAMPEIISAFRTLNMGAPEDFYDAIITAGYPLRKGAVGTLGELSPKPHPWLYAETFRVGLGLGFEDRNSIIGIEDSAAGVCSIRLAGIPTIGVDGGNIVQSGTKSLCDYYCNGLKDILEIIR